MSAAEHEHKWQGQMHMDGCHHYSNTYTCACGAALQISGERTFFSRGRMQPDLYMADDTGTCQRCRELIAGKRRRPTLTLIREKDGPLMRRLRDGREVPA